MQLRCESVKTERIQEIKIHESERKRNTSPFFWIILFVALPTMAAVVLAAMRQQGERTIGEINQSSASENPTSAPAPTTAVVAAPETKDGEEILLTVSGYIINRERIELSPRSLGVVKWLGAKKGDRVKKGDVLVLLDDAEERARLEEAKKRLAVAQAQHRQVEARLARARALRESRVSSAEELENLEWEEQAARARVEEAEAAVRTAQTYLDWTVIRAPIDGVILEKLVDVNELVSPQSFGGERSPSTALVAIADPNDLQVEIELNERDIAKVSLGLRCRVSPEAYPERSYDGYVAEMAPEASRQKGTLQLKVQIENPDEFLTPNLNAKVDFINPSKRSPSGSSIRETETGTTGSPGQ